MPCPRSILRDPARKAARGRPWVLAVVMTTTLLFAGCASEDATPTATTTSAAAPEPMLQGVVLDMGLRPLANATVRVQDTNETTRTDAEGLYRFEVLPVERVLVLVATKDGFTPDARQVTLAAGAPMRLDFTMAAVPVLQPRSHVLPFEGFIACEAAVEVSENRSSFDCAAGAPDNAHWDFSVEPDLAGAVVEVAWNATQPGANFLGARLETIGLGSYNTQLTEVVGASPLRLVVPQATAQRYYASGGIVRLTVFAHPDNDAHEAGAGSALAVQQDFRAFASLFYVEPPHPTYTVFDP